MRPKRSKYKPRPQTGNRVRLGERIDPAAADALWRIVLGREPEEPGRLNGEADGGR
ncbi:MAG: hypothetical protein WEE36_08725 [Acidimicrobiia bacterium]